MKLSMGKVLVASLMLVAGMAQAAHIQAAYNGFSGTFDSSNWQSGSNAPVNLVSTSPTSVTLSNYAPWATSGATFRYPSTPFNGVLTFNYSTTGTTSACPAAYELANQSQILASGTNQTVTVNVQAGQEFGFALNGQDSPSSFGCTSHGSQVTFTVNSFQFASQ